MSEHEEDFQPSRWNLSRWALEHPALVRFLIVLFLIIGARAYFMLGQAEDPPFTFKAMVVRAIWPGATAREVEEALTEKIEKKLQEVPYLDFTRSFSKPGEMAIIISLRDEARGEVVTDAWYQVRKKVGDIRGDLPPGVIGPFFNDEFGDTFGSVFAVTGDGFSSRDLRAAAEKMRAEVLRLANVGKVELFGLVDEKIYVELSTKKLAELGVSVQQLISELQTQNDVTPTGRIDTDTLSIYVRPSGRFSSEDRVKDVALRAAGRSIRLGDIARVYRADQDPPQYLTRYRGEPAVMVGVSMAKGGDVIQLGRDLDTLFARVKHDFPVGLEITQVHDQPRLVRTAVSLFMQSLAEALLIVLAVTFVTLHWRAGVVVALSIPLVLAITFVIMWFFKIDLHRISTGALIIALGLLVDDAIIAVEMMAHKMEVGWDRFKAATYAFHSTAFPMLTGTLLTATAFLPIALAKSTTGEYTFAIFAVTASALITSWFVAVIFTPFIGYKLLKPHHVPDGHDPYQTKNYRRLRAAVSWCVDHRAIVIVLTVLAFAAGLGLMRVVQKQFFPLSERLEILVDLWLPEGASYEATLRESKKFEAFIKDEPGVAHYMGYVGKGSMRFFLALDEQLINRNYAQYVVVVKDLKAREETLAKIKQAFAEDFSNVRGRAVRFEYGPPVGYAVQYRLSSFDLVALRNQAEKLATIVRANPNATNTSLDWNEKSLVARLDIDQDKIKALGLNSQTVARAANLLLSGFASTQYREGDQLIDVVLRAPHDERGNLDFLRDITIGTTGGKAVSLGQIANIKAEFEEGVIWRRNREPTITVRADVQGGLEPATVIDQLAPKVAEFKTQLPEGFRIEIGGPVETSEKANRSLAVTMPIIIITTLTLLMIQLQSFPRTMLVVLTAPLGVIGVAIALLVSGKPMGFVALLGIISLAGMIMRNSVILVDQIDQDIKRGLTQWDAIVESTVRRARPIVLTAAAAILAMIPLSRSIFWGPMAIAVMGGLVVATILTLFFLPALYAAWYRVKRATVHA